MRAVFLERPLSHTCVRVHRAVPHWNPRARAQGYEVHGIIRRSSSFNTGRIEQLYQDRHAKGVRFFLHYGDLTDAVNLMHLVHTIRPDELYNLGAQSHVKISFEMPEYTANTDALGTLRLLDAIRSAGLEKTCKFYQARRQARGGG